MTDDWPKGEIENEYADATFLYETLRDIESKEGLHVEVLVEVIRGIISATKHNSPLDIRQCVTNGMVEWDL